MSFTTSTVLGLQKPSDGDTTWGDEVRAIYETVDKINGPTNCWFVSPAFTDTVIANTPSDRRHYDTIQEAIDTAEAVGTNSQHTIILYPSIYAENITVTKRIGICGVSGHRGVAYNGHLGGQLPQIMGATGSSTVTFTPEESNVCGLSLANLSLDNSHTTLAGAQTWPLLVKVDPQTLYGGQPSRFNMSNVHYTDGAVTDQFNEGFKVEGWVNVSVVDCQFRFPHSEVSDPDYRITYPFYLKGDNASKAVFIQIKRSDFYHEGTNGATFLIGDNANIQSTYSSYTRATGNAVYDTGVGSNNKGELEDGPSALAAMNIMGINSVIGY